MKINVKLSPDYEQKWKRLLAVYGPNTDELALCAVDLLWAKCHKKVESSERMFQSLVLKTRTAEKKLEKIQKPIKSQAAPSVLVGSYRSKVTAKGSVRIPEDWFPCFKGGSAVVAFCADDGCVQIAPLPSDKIRKDEMPKDVCIVKIGSRGQIVLNAKKTCKH